MRNIFSTATLHSSHQAVSWHVQRRRSRPVEHHVRCPSSQFISSNNKPAFRSSCSSLIIHWITAGAFYIIRNVLCVGVWVRWKNGQSQGEQTVQLDCVGSRMECGVFGCGSIVRIAVFHVPHRVSLKHTHRHTHIRLSFKSENNAWKHLHPAGDKLPSNSIQNGENRKKSVFSSWNVKCIHYTTCSFHVRPAVAVAAEWIHFLYIHFESSHKSFIFSIFTFVRSFFPMHSMNFSFLLCRYPSGLLGNRGVEYFFSLFHSSSFSLGGKWMLC